MQFLCKLKIQDEMLTMCPLRRTDKNLVPPLGIYEHEIHVFLKCYNSAFVHR